MCARPVGRYADCEALSGLKRVWESRRVLEVVTRFRPLRCKPLKTVWPWSVLQRLRRRLKPNRIFPTPSTCLPPTMSHPITGRLRSPGIQALHPSSTGCARSTLLGAFSLQYKSFWIGILRIPAVSQRHATSLRSQPPVFLSSGSSLDRGICVTTRAHQWKRKR
ncbi:hypothetical protein B0H19DRAFT_1235975 [Mycena capillaripes]|nr:hypothetical protein B0H19DRAFT_1235975 [Mycena capillaripes]